MNHISAKLIRISCRVFDAAVKFAMVIDAAKKQASQATMRNHLEAKSKGTRTMIW